MPQFDVQTLPRFMLFSPLDELFCSLHLNETKTSSKNKQSILFLLKINIYFLI